MFILILFLCLNSHPFVFGNVLGNDRHISYETLVTKRLNSDSNPIVETECGNVLGTYNSSLDLASFKGIPFAAPPLENLRWAPPISRSDAGMCWHSSTWNATEYGEYCVQSGQFQHGGSEDCLFLNIWSPRWSKKHVNEALPVMVYLYGGDLTDGQSNSYPLDILSYDGNVVAVSINYRVNLFGFLATKELSEASTRGSSGNYGFQDQQLALKWIQSNIAAFGGDPNRVTLFGQSSGGTSIFALLSSPASKGLFHAAISLSGSPNLTMPLSVAETQNADLVAEMGCRNASWSAKKTVECMRSKTTDEIKDVIPQSWDTVKRLWAWPPPEAASNPKGMNYPGVAIVDGVVVVKPFLEALEEGLIDVPVIFGNMAQEPDAQPGQHYLNTPVAQFKDIVRKTFSPWGQDSGNEILQMYAKDLDHGGPQKAYDHILADFGAVCGNIAVAKAAAKGFKSPVYSYVITQCPVQPVWNFDPTYQCRFAFHSFDVLAGLRAYGLFAGGMGLPVYQPHACDLQFGDIVRAGWVQLAYNLSLDTNLPGGWSPINASPQWPNSYNVGLIGNSGRHCPGTVSTTDKYISAVNSMHMRGSYSTTQSNTDTCDDLATVTNVDAYNQDVCAWWLAKGFDQRFWWCN